MEQDVKTYKNAVLTNRQPMAGEMQSAADEPVIETNRSEGCPIIRRQMKFGSWVPIRQSQLTNFLLATKFANYNWRNAFRQLIMVQMKNSQHC